MGIGQRIKDRRKALKMSAEELGRRLGKDRSTIYRYEKGDIENLPLDILEPIAKALNTTPQYLMGWQEKIEKDPVGTAERHFEILMDEDFVELFPGFQRLDTKKRKVVKDLIDTLADTEMEV
jgi:transcriptional regulator with XRE-family HTH domain